MTDNGQVPEGGRAGQPTPRGGPGTRGPGAPFPFPGQGEEAGDDEELLMPGAPGAWADAVVAPPPSSLAGPVGTPAAGTPTPQAAAVAPPVVQVVPVAAAAPVAAVPAQQPAPRSGEAAAPEPVPAASIPANDPPASGTPASGTPVPGAVAAEPAPVPVPVGHTPARGTPAHAAPTPPAAPSEPSAPHAIPVEQAPAVPAPHAAEPVAPVAVAVPPAGTPTPAAGTPSQTVTVEPPPEEAAAPEGAPPQARDAAAVTPIAVGPAVPAPVEAPVAPPTATPPAGVPSPGPAAPTPPAGTPLPPAPESAESPAADAGTPQAAPTEATPAEGIPPEGAASPVEAAPTEVTATEATTVETSSPETSSPEASSPETAQTETPPVEEPSAGTPSTDAGSPEETVGTEAAPAAPVPTADREAVHRLMREQRDVRHGFRSDPVPDDVLLRVLQAAHTAPSVGLAQPWDFVIIRSPETRQRVQELATRQREAYAASLPRARARHFKELTVEAIGATPVNIVVTADPTRGGRQSLGPVSEPQIAPYSVALAVENLWLAAHAEGLGVGWVSFFDERELTAALDLPEHLQLVAYLCVGYVDEFPAASEPAAEGGAAAQHRPLSWVVHEESYGRRALPGAAPHDLLGETLSEIRPLDAQALGEAWERQKRMTKPTGSLGALEAIAAQLCGLARSCPPPLPEPAALAVFAGDHGVHRQGVTPWPQEVTGQMVTNFLGGGAVCNAFADQVGAEICVVDVGVRGELPSSPGLVPRRVRPGTADFTEEPAMSREEALRAVEVGIETARDLVAAGHRALLTGEMGIANTTVSAALVAAFTGADPADVTGRGTGVDDETHARKIDVVRRALQRHQPSPEDPLAVLASVGGLEHAALTGLILGGAALRVPVVLDGVSAGAAALVARAFQPEAVAACIAGHRSAEPGHHVALSALGLRPLVDLDLRLGEGTGALLALPVVQSAARALREVATFDSAGVTDKN
ncbi:nicotinate-nucleotide--dimethylbenzimidazole phosphoribosyltransferase [Streptomyces sp. 4N509B]|uniref:nicotinate-nucleotide--dimethylbenzimidazole phosphoribosyltransferase n=1 Tax=Streptomyces sp. 4N509B TaxID=3457413 RepID=UPI003FCFC6AF